MKHSRDVSRRFPDYGWAWPAGGLDQLLKAIMLPDGILAERLAMEWLDGHDINNASFAEHRLLAALTERHGKRLSSHPSYPRMAGLQKMLWSRSRLTYREARPVLMALAQADCPVMLLKGASRVAIDPEAQRGRVSHDVDILVRPENMMDVLDILLEHGWIASTGVGPLYLKKRIQSFRGLNFYKGEHGDLDLHQDAYHLSQKNLNDDQALWRRAKVAQLEQVRVLVPSPADQISLAVGHSGLDAHVHSDWLVDINAAIRRGDVDWTVLLEILAARRLFVPAAISLTYLYRSICTPIPEHVLAEVIERADRTGLVGRLSILEAKPRRDFGRLSRLVRGVIKQIRLSRASPIGRDFKDTVWRGRARLAKQHDMPAVSSVISRLKIPVEMARSRPVHVEIRMLIFVPGGARRFEFELSTESHHVARLRYRMLAGRPGARELHFDGLIEIEEATKTLVLEARPSRHFRNWNNPKDVRRYGKVPFMLLASRWTDANRVIELQSNLSLRPDERCTQPVENRS